MEWKTRMVERGTSPEPRRFPILEAILVSFRQLAFKDAASGYVEMGSIR